MGALQVLKRRYAELAAQEGALAPGYRTLCTGLQQVLDAAAPQTEPSDATRDPDEALRLELLSLGLAAMADLLEAPAAASGAQDAAPPPTTTPQTATDDANAQFQQMFRREARQQMRALAIAMMGILTDQGVSDAVGRAARCLHAMRGAAAMVALSDLAKLAAAMEAVVKHIDAQSAHARTRPARALLGGFRLLEAALDSADFTVDPARLAQISRALHAYHPGAPTPPPQRSQPSPPSQPLQQQAAPAATAVPRKRILVVDDVETVAASIGFVLAELAVPIDVARHGAHALEMLHQRPYSLVVTDIDMPHMDGTTLTRMIRHDPALRDIPVIVLTSLDHPEERDAGIEAGANDYVIKGAIGGGELLARVRALLQIAPDVPAPKPARLRVLIAEDVDTIAASIAFVLSEGPFTLEIARDGARALSCLRQRRYDILLSDVEMPEMDGLALLEAVRDDDALVDLPVILLTSVQDPEVEQRALNLGADRFLLKGDVSGDQLRQILEAAHAARAQRARIEHIDLDPTHFPDPTPPQ